ncbi:hypothetical protein BD410DRAFT_793469 [Rickenella mellea]|uniref:Zn(2)-C6 fungal-type domain-containing protein n=1 Tax=Rickenella mellea TaxID=50990 RepID=A0A4Y7PSY6_9AGAM|nr:hypothetical protein BD410DRAFT_793469 [Rickenella mellea]
MPVDVSGKEKRTSRRAGYSVELKQIDQELKRNRGEIACVECNRLKVKCDKRPFQIPCSSCVRRGFSHLCPNSSLSDAKDMSPLTDTEALKLKLLEINERNRQLEDALRVATADSPTRHPLLRAELSTKRGFADDNDTKPVVKQESDLTDDFGTLTIDDDGTSRFLGRTGGGESLMMSGLLVERDALSHVMLGGSRASNGLGPYLSSGDIRQAEERMPTYERATTLCETYLQQASWFFRVVRRQQLMDELLIPIYKRMESNPSHSNNFDDDVLYRHCLALLLSIFAMGALQDLTLPPHNDEAHAYYLTSRSLIDVESAADSPSLTIVQALCTMCSYYTQSGRIHSMDRPLAMLGYVAILAAAIGLHRDPARWKLDDKAVQRRREVFWQLFMVMNWQGLKSGRPLVFTLPFIDTELPDDFEQTLASDGSALMGGWRWMYTFTKEILYEINIMSNRVGSVTYSDVIELDRKIREFEVPQHLQARPTESSWENDGPYAVMQRFLVVSGHHTTFIELHRNYFAKALLECPKDPLSSQYSSSFLSTYRASMAVIRNLREHYNVCPDFLVRVLVAWIHVFSALVVLGAVVIRGPTSSLAPAAMIELTLGVGLFEKAAAAGTPFAKRSLTVLIGIRERALATYTRHRNGQPIVDKSVTQGSTGTYWVSKMDLFCGPSSATSASGNQSGSVTYVSSPSPPSSDSSLASPPANSNSATDILVVTPGSKSPEDAFQTHELKHSEQLTTSSHTVEKSNSLSQIPDYVSEQDLAAFLVAVSQSYSAAAPFPSTPAGLMSIPPPLSETSLRPQVPQGRSNAFGSTGAAGGAYDVELASTMAFDMDAFGTMDAFGMSSMDVAMDESWSTFLQDSGFMLNTADPFSPPSFA